MALRSSLVDNNPQLLFTASETRDHVFDISVFFPQNVTSKLPLLNSTSIFDSFLNFQVFLVFVKEAEIKPLKLPVPRQESTVERPLLLGQGVVFDTDFVRGTRLSFECSATINVSDFTNFEDFFHLAFTPVNHSFFFTESTWEGISLRVINKETNSVIERRRTQFDINVTLVGNSINFFDTVQEEFELTPVGSSTR